MSRLDSNHSIKGRIPISLKMAWASSSKDMAFARSPARERRDGRCRDDAVSSMRGKPKFL